MLTVFKQELLLRLRQGATWGQFLFIFVIAAAIMGTERGDTDNGRLLVNAPTQLVLYSSIFCLLAGPIIAAVAGTSILRDFELRVHEFFFTSRLRAWQYFFGRYFGSFCVTALLFTALPLGLWLGTVLPGDSTHVAPFRLLPYLFCYAVVLLPNLLLTSALFFVGGALTRSVFAVYALGIVLFVLYLLSVSVGSALGTRDAVALLDPYGIVLFNKETEYWSPAQKNQTLPTLDGALLFNRFLWSGIGLGVLGLGSLVFRFRALTPQLPRRARKSKIVPPPQGAVPHGIAQPRAVRSFLHLVRFYVRQTLRSWPYWLFLALGLFAFAISGQKEEGLTGTALLPTTRFMVQEVRQGFVALFVFVAAIYAGELCWQERTLRVAPLVDTLPLSRTLLMLSRFVALQLLLALAGAVYAGFGMLLQLRGGVTPEPAAYGVSLFWEGGIQLLSLSALAFLVQSRAPNKFLGHLIVVVSTLLSSVFDELGWEHPLLDLGSMGSIGYSDLDGFRAFQAPLLALGGHWLLFSALLLGLALRPQRRRGLAILAGFCVVSTGLLLYNYHGIHRFQTEKSIQQDQADYERLYRTVWLERPQPRIVAADLDITLWPERRAFKISGRYTLANKTPRPVTDILLSYDSDLALQALSFGIAAQRTENNPRLGVQVWRLAAPLAPGAQTTLDFVLLWDKPGFSASGPRTDIATNGSFLSNLAPRIGYLTAVELTDPAVRKKQRLGAWQELPEPVGVRQTYIGGDSDWVALAMTVRTAPDQLALAPGKLQKEWREGGRRCFRYISERPIRYFWAVVSGKYATRTTRWNGVPLTVYYHAGHAWNIERILEGAKQALTFCTKTYGPYPFSELRIVEFPARGEAVAAQAFAGTIPFSEDGGFTMQVEAGDFDTPFYVTAHEVAHQWWGHQLTGANLPGSEVLSESLAEYTALRVAVLAGNHPDDVYRRAADAYLKGRATDRQEERPLVATRRQPYLCYQKGGLAFQELRWLTRQRLDTVLRGFLERLAFQEPPYATAQVLVDVLKASFPAHAPRITELFEKITLSELKVSGAKTTQVGKKRWRTVFTVTAKKVYADGLGNETPAPLHDTVAVSLWTKTEVATLPITLQQNQQVCALETRFRPAFVRLDPSYSQLDRERENNTTAVE